MNQTVQNNVIIMPDREKATLAKNAWHLARYALEHDNPKRKLLPEGFDVGHFMTMCEMFPRLNSRNQIRFINEYAKLEAALGNVTARTIVATQIHGKSFFRAMSGTAVGKYLLLLFALVTFFTTLLFLNIFSDISADFLDIVTIPEQASFASLSLYYLVYITLDVIASDIFIPFLAAGLGTCFFLMRSTHEKLTSREFDPSRIPGHMVRLVMGISAGGAIALFPDLMQTGLSSSPDEDTVGLAQGAVAFLIGYGVELFYNGLDSLKNKLAS